MKKMATIHELRDELAIARQSGKRIGFVPTMGYLHQGHLSLVEQAKAKSDLVVMSIFVNPTQFGPNEDYAKYPRDLDRDEKLAREAGVDLLFVPDVSEMYPDQRLTTVSVAGITSALCGLSRPGHFDGVATVVAKLFNIVQPDFAFFGLKDAQQVAVIKQMVHDLNIPVTIVSCPIVRENDGLAMSSRNVYLSSEERKQAVVLFESLHKAQRWIQEGVYDAAELKKKIVENIEKMPLAKIDYVEVLAYPTLQPVNDLRGESIIIALAVFFGQTRLIDNMILNVTANEEKEEKTQMYC